MATDDWLVTVALVFLVGLGIGWLQGPWTGSVLLFWLTLPIYVAFVILKYTIMYTGALFEFTVVRWWRTRQRRLANSGSQFRY